MTLRRSPFVWLVALGLVAHIGASWLRGTGDVLTFKRWGLATVDAGVLDTYKRVPEATRGNLNVPPDYPPIAIMILAATAQAAEILEPRLVPTSRLHTVVLKAMLVTARLAVLAAIVFFVGRLTDDWSLARWAGLAYWLNPALVLAGPALGYLDILCWIPGLVAILMMSRARPFLAGVLVVASALTKPQGLFFLMPIASMSWGAPARTILRVTVGMLVTLSVLLLPFALATPHGFLQGMRVNFSEDMLSGDALNFWWIVGAAGRVVRGGLAEMALPLQAPSLSHFASSAGFNPRLPAAAFVIAVAIAISWHVRGRISAALQTAACAFIIHVYFVFAINVHENHLVYALPLIGITALTNAAYRRLYVWTSIFVTVNLLITYGLGRDFTRIPRVGIFWPASVVVAFAGIVLLAHHARLFLDLSRRSITASGGDRV